MKFSKQLMTFALSLAGLAGPSFADVNQDTKPDLLWRDKNSGEISAWLLNGGTVLGNESLSWRCGPACFQSWKPVGMLSDTRLLWHNAGTGELSSWVMSGPTVLRTETLSWQCGPACNQDWKAVGTGYFHLDGVSRGVLWHNVTTGDVGVWMVNGATVTEAQPLVGGRCDAASGCSQAWKVVGVNRHGAPNVLWYNASTGTLLYWVMGETPGLDHPGPGQFPAPYYTTVKSAQALSWSCATSTGCAQSWKVIGVEDVDYDGQDDVIWYNATTGEVAAWLLSGFSVKGTLSLSWKCAAASGCANEWEPMGFVPASPPIVH